MAKYIQHQLFYPSSPATVWEYLTNPELLSKWLMPSNFEPVVGHEFQFNTKAKPDVDFDGTFYCKVLEVVPLKKLSYSWKFGPAKDKLNDSIVHWTLSEKDNGTELLLIHDGFKQTDNLPIFELLNAGWLQNINKILTLITTANGTITA